MSRINLIFDADDTLWQTEHLYDNARDRAVNLMALQKLGRRGEIEERARAIDRDNRGIMGLGKRRFPTSLVQTYRELCKENGLSADDAIARQIEEIGESVFTTKAPLVPEVEATLHNLAERGCGLYLWTQGDAEVQERRIVESGLARFFANHIHIGSSKTVSSLISTIKEWDPSFPPTETSTQDQNQWWVIGNTVKSDINPALLAGLKAIWIPSPVWETEVEDFKDHRDSQLFVVPKISDIQSVVIPTLKEDRFREQLSTTGAVVYLFVSAYHDLYRQYVMDILAYPRNYVFRFPYDNRWLPTIYRQKPREFWLLLQNRKAVIVFVDERKEREPRREQRFYPIRTATITVDSNQELHVEGGILQIAFRLGDYVDYGRSTAERSRKAREFDTQIRTLEARPRMTLEESSYISLGVDLTSVISFASDPKKDDDAWNSIISIFGDLHKDHAVQQINPYVPRYPSPFEYAMFFRVVNLVDLGGKDAFAELRIAIGSRLMRLLRRATNEQHESAATPVPLKNVFDGASGYELKGSRNYRMNLIFYHPYRPRHEVRRSKIIAQLTPDLVSGVGSLEIPLNFRYDRRQIDFVTAQVFYESWASIAMRSVEPDDHKLTEEEQVVTPMPTFLFHLKVNRWGQIVAPFLFALFVGIGSMAGTVAAIYSNPNATSKAEAFLLSTLIALIGSVGSTLILFYLYRKLR